MNKWWKYFLATFITSIIISLTGYKGVSGLMGLLGTLLATYFLFFQKKSNSTVKKQDEVQALNDEEKSAIISLLTKKFNFRGGDYWDPIHSEAPEPTIFIRRTNLSEGDVLQIVQFLISKYNNMIFEIDEANEIYTTDYNAIYLGSIEMLYCDNSFEWIISTTQESTVTFGGNDLIAFVRTLFSNREMLLNKWDE